MAAAILLGDWRHRPAAVMAALGLLSGILSGWVGYAYEPAWLKSVGDVLFIDGGMVPVGAFFGAVVAVGLAMLTGKAWGLPITFVTTLYAWSAAVHTAIRLQTNSGGAVRLVLASLAAGAIGAGLTHLGGALVAPELRRPGPIATTIVVGAFAGLVFYFTERNYVYPSVLFIVWQPAVAYCIGLALSHKDAGA